MKAVHLKPRRQIAIMIIPKKGKVFDDSGLGVRYGSLEIWTDRPLPILPGYRALFCYLCRHLHCPHRAISPPDHRLRMSTRPADDPGSTFRPIDQ